MAEQLCGQGQLPILLRTIMQHSALGQHTPGSQPLPLRPELCSQAPYTAPAALKVLRPHQHEWVKGGLGIDSGDINHIGGPTGRSAVVSSGPTAQGHEHL